MGRRRNKEIREGLRKEARERRRNNRTGEGSEARARR
jgi:hypothetical protein